MAKPQPPSGASVRRDASAVASAWAARADELARWAFARLVVRSDAWGGYRPPEEWGKEYLKPDGTIGKLGQTTTRKGRLTEALLARHFRATERGDLIGLHSTSADNTSLWGGVDIDWHGPTSTAPEINARAALAWYDSLTAGGFHPLLTDSNGAGSYHLLVLLAEAVLTSRLYHFLKRLVGDHARHGMTRPPETFPKQAALRPGTAYGNWLRLPGRHHSREHWSRVWDGARWLDGGEAVAFLLRLAGDDPGLIPEVLTRSAPTPRSHVKRTRRSHIISIPAAFGDDPAGRAAAYLARLPHLGEGQGRDDVGYRFAAFLLRDLALPRDLASDWLSRWDAGNHPPKGKAAIDRWLANAARYGRRAVGPALPSAPASGPLKVIRCRRGHYILSGKIEVR
jgi:hypothetical protein